MIFDTLVCLAIFNASLSAFDGAAFLSCREFPSGYDGNTVISKETGPAKYLAGENPTIGSFLLAGIAEVAVMSAVSYGLKRLGLKYWWLPQVSISVYHGFLGVENIRAHRELMRYGKQQGYY